MAEVNKFTLDFLPRVLIHSKPNQNHGKAQPLPANRLRRVLLAKLKATTNVPHSLLGLSPPPKQCYRPLHD